MVGEGLPDFIDGGLAVIEPLRLARQILVQILSSGPQLGAKVKPRLLAEFYRQSGLDFQRTAGAGFFKFSEFLAANADLVQIVSPSSPGDILIALRERSAAVASPNAVSISTDTATPAIPPQIRAEVWQAFTNPDIRRRRFYHRQTGEVIHFREGSSLPMDAEFSRRAESDPAFVEIDYVPAARHTAWMTDFLNSSALPEWIKRVANHFSGVPYESSVNRAFAASLGPYAGAWNRFRSVKVFESVKEWAAKRGIGVERLVESWQPSEYLKAEPKSEVSAEAAPRQDAAPDSDLRKALHTLIDSLGADDLAHIMMPATLVARMNLRRG